MQPTHSGKCDWAELSDIDVGREGKMPRFFDWANQHSTGALSRGLFWGAALAVGLGFADARADQFPPPIPAPPSVANNPAGAAGRPVPLAPIGIFGANQPNANQFVLSEISAYSRSDGNLIGTNSVSPNYIVSNILSNRTPVPGNHLLRVAPLNGQAYGQFVSLAYGITDKFAVVAVGGWLHKEKELETFKGSAGTTVLGTSTPYTRGFSDTTVAGLYRIYQDPMNAITVGLGIGIPTGNFSNYWTPLSPAGTYPSKVAVYGMQEGSGSVTALPAIAYTGVLNQWAWGLAYRAALPLDYNSNGWRFGDLHTASAWGGYSWLPGFMTTLRVGATTQSSIRGSSPAILGYAEGNVPAFAGGQWVDVNLGVTASGALVGIPRLTIQAEAGLPVYQNLYGPQAASQWSGVIRTQYRF
jgi:hypothetical protein